MKTLNLLLLSLLLSLFAFEGKAQTADSTILWRVVTTDNNEYIGVMIQRNTEEVQLRTTKLGTITLQVRDIRKMEQISENLMVNGEIWPENPQATRYLWNTNGYGINRGEGYYQNVWVLFNQASFGLTNNISISVGMVPLFLFAGTSTPLWVVPKFSAPIVKDKFNVGGGILVATIVGEDSGTAGVAFGSATYGSRDRNINLGAGFGFAEGEWSSTPVITFSGMHRYSKRGYILTENYYFGFGDFSAAILSFAGRTVWEGVSLDYGVIVPAGDDIDAFIGIPWLGLIIPFGNK